MPSTLSLRRRQSGFSLIELMIASVIGLILLGGLSLIFVSSSETNRELQKTAQQIENGRYAIDTLTQNLRLAGFYGHLYDLSTITPVPGTPPDPCELTAAALRSALWYPVNAYFGTMGGAAADVSATSCGALTADNLQPGSDVLVIRRADTNVLVAASPKAAGAYYIQSTAYEAQIQVGDADGTIGACTNSFPCKAEGGDADLKLSNGAIPAPAAPLRKFQVHVYFVAPCSIGTNTVGGIAGVCQAGDDTIPTLKRLELSSDPANTPGQFVIVPLVEGIELLKVAFGVDTAPTAVNMATGLSGDAAVDSYTAVEAAPGNWREVIAARVYVLARNTEPTRDFKDDKTYTFAGASVGPMNDQYKRHVFSAAVRLTNPAGRREIP